MKQYPIKEDLPTVTIIIATYNSAETIRIALDSVLQQTFQEWECIVVDGASSDNTIDIVREFCKVDSRFHFISEKDNGIYDAYNKGWRMAKGKWILYLGSDDKLSNNGVQDLVANSDGGDLIVGNVYLVKPWGEVTKQYAQGRNGCHQSMITRRTVIEALKGFDEQYKILADADLNIRLEMNGYVIKNIDSFVSYFSVNGVSQSMNNLFARAKERYYIYKRNNYCRYPLWRSTRKYARDILTCMYRKLKMKT